VGARGRVSAHATLPSEYALVGGGARTWWEHPPWPGSLLTASFGSSDTWTAEAKDHVTPSPVVVTAFAIGLSRALMARISVQVISASDTSHLLQHRPSATADLTVGFAAAPGAVGVMTGGGARSDSQGPGSLLITSDPKDKTKWIAASKDHEVPDPTTIESFALGSSPSSSPRASSKGLVVRARLRVALRVARPEEERMKWRVARQAQAAATCLLWIR